MNKIERQYVAQIAEIHFVNRNNYTYMMEEVDFDVNALLDEIEEKSSKVVDKPKISMKKVLIDVPFLDIENSTETCSKVKEVTPDRKREDVEPLDSVVHTGDTDSSDDEENKYFEERMYNSCGSDIKNLLKIKKSASKSYVPLCNAKALAKPKSDATSNQYNLGLSSAPTKKDSPGDEKKSAQTFDSYKDPIFGLSIINPLLSSAMVKSKMIGRTPVSFFKLRNHVLHGDLKTDWVLGGVIVNKTPTKVSQKGKKYLIWTLSDLKTGLLTAGLFLFGRAYENLWKTQIGAVVGILNPSPLSSNNDKNSKDKDEAKLSILDPDQVMLLGRSKDLGTCKGKKKDGNDCSAFVNSRECTFCSYHVASAYREYKGRGELQSPTCGSMKSLQNKVLGKNEVFYGGKSFVAQPTKGSSKKVLALDKQRLASLGANVNKKSPESSGPISPALLSARSASLLSMLGNSSVGNKPSASPQTKDAQRLASLSSNTKSTASSDDSVHPAKSTPQPTNKSKMPELSNPEGEFIEFDLPPPKPAAKQRTTQQLGTPRPKSKQQKPTEVKLQTKFNSLMNMKKDPPKNDLKSGFSFKEEKESTSSSNVSNSTVQKGQSTKSLSGNNLDVNIESKAESGNKVSNLLERSPSTVNALPVKGTEAIRTMVNVITRSPTSRTSRAKLRALQIVKKKGGISRENPRGVTREELVGRGLKRHLEENDVDDDPKEELKNSVLSQRFMELMNMESRHTDLLEEFDQKQEDAYYEKLERKEQMEEKMMSIFKLECKAVRCMKCRYTWFSASDECKAERHPLKVIDTVKRFFKCNDCGNRTVSLSLLPLLPCKKCSSTSWVKTAMMKEKIVKSSHELSIRGGEQKFINSVASNANINLLMPQ